MKNQIKVGCIEAFNLDSTIVFLKKELIKRGFQLNETSKDYKIFMFRKNENVWTQVYARKKRLYLTVSGPEKGVLFELKKIRLF